MKAQRGFTLLEVVISILLTAVIAASVFSIAASSKQSTGKTERRMIAGQLGRQLTALLRAFVTADPSTTLVSGPNSGADSWAMTGGGFKDDCGTGTWPTDCYALSPGSHTIKGFVPDWFASPPYAGTITYFVGYPAAWPYSVSGGTVPVVSITVKWTEP